MAQRPPAAHLAYSSQIMASIRRIDNVNHIDVVMSEVARAINAHPNIEPYVSIFRSPGPTPSPISDRETPAITTKTSLRQRRDLSSAELTQLYSVLTRKIGPDKIKTNN